ncbi:MAG TPA: acetyl-CoA acetyltransferase [Dehalococcoidia bacterium]|nr:acetyl-CoA acetyltransferase [Dehalococcoidia bacterium]
MDDRLPIIAGVGQVTQRPDTERPREPLALMAEAARLAEADCGVAGVLQSLDSIRVVNVISWPSRAPAQDLARALAVAPREQLYTHIGGNTPQWLVNEAAEAIHHGELKVVLIAGAEAMYAARRARARGVDLGWSPRGNPAPDIGDPRAGVNAMEAKHGATLPTSVYPLFENALRAHYGRTIEAHQRTLGELCAGFSSVATANPYAWFREARTAREIAAPDAGNRYIGFPYPKYMNAILDVDQGAALLLTSAGEARRLGIPGERWVYVRGCGDATDHWFVTERVDYHSSPAIRAAGQRALSMAGVGIDEVAHIDLYSCFPSAVQIARDMLGIAPNDGRALTVTGGLPYFGGPGNNYVTHSIATMVEKLRADRGALGLVTANGWYVTKHAAGVYSTEPPAGEWRRTAPRVDQAAIDGEPHPPLAKEPAGAATVETYTVLFDREGAPERGIVIGRLGDGSRFIANTPGDGRTLEGMTRQEMVGTPGRVTVSAEGTNLFVPG